MATIGFASDRYGNLGGRATDTGAIDYTTVAADIATLVADGASPTQGHVNTLNSDWATLKTTLDLSVAVPTAGLKVIIDTTMTKNQALAALEKIMAAVRASSLT